MLTVVISQGQSRNPEKRALEQAIAERAAAMDGVSVVLIPHLYDLTIDSESFSKIRQTPGPLLVFSWMYQRGTRWVLDRNGIRGQSGEVLLTDVSDEDDSDETSEADDEKPRVLADRIPPNRPIYCLDFRYSDSPVPFIDEMARIAAINQPVDSPPSLFGVGAVTQIDDHPLRRWYPVIDFSRCTNCMECIDFCLFGVYGVDGVDTILVEQPDNCRKGCPACSRVCPENAIIFPQHKTPAIAGAPVAMGSFKIDLSKLFGAPDSGEDAVQAAVRERDEQLILTGRAAVGDAVGLRTQATSPASRPKDDLDQLLDRLDALDL